MSIYLDEKNPEKHKPFDDASPDIVAYVRYLEVIAGKSPNTAFSYYCDLRNFSRFMKRRRGLVTDDTEIKDIDPKGLDTAFWGSVTKEDVYEYLYFLNSECGNKKSSTARRLASLHGFYDYLVNQVDLLKENPTASIKPPKQDKVLPKYLTAEQSMDLLESTQTQSDFPERDYCMVVLFLNCGMRLSELFGMESAARTEVVIKSRMFMTCSAIHSTIPSSIPMKEPPPYLHYPFHCPPAKNGVM